MHLGELSDSSHLHAHSAVPLSNKTVFKLHFTNSSATSEQSGHVTTQAPLIFPSCFTKPNEKAAIMSSSSVQELKAPHNFLANFGSAVGA